MANINQKKQDDSKKIMNSAVARVSGAVQVAGIAVSETMAIKDEALDDVRASKKESNVKAGDKAIKKIKKNSKKVLGKSK